MSAEDKLPTMTAEAALRYWHLFEAHDLSVCIDGGWAVDALLGEQTRHHKDLDIALPASGIPLLRQLLDARGFVEIPWPDSWEHNFVMRNPDGETLDIHSYELNSDGTNRLGVPYRAEHFLGKGTILGEPVKCITPKWLVSFHSGYEIAEKDWHDVRRLCERFDLPIPEIYARFQRS